MLLQDIRTDDTTVNAERSDYGLNWLDWTKASLQPL